MNQPSKKSQTPKKRVEGPKNRSEHGSVSGKASMKSPSRCSATQATPLVEDTVLQSLSQELAYLHNRVCVLPNDSPIQIQLPKEMFHYDNDATAWLFKEDVKEFLSGAMLNISLIQISMRALQEQIWELESPCQVGWLCPEQMSTARILGNSADVLYYAERGIRQSVSAGDKFIFVPYYEDYHWTLLVICVSSNTIFYFDSSRLPQVRKRLVRSILQNTMKKINPRSPRGPTWKAPKCAQQENGVDCGLYVMRFMYDIVMSHCTDTRQLEEFCKGQTGLPYTSEELHVIREMLATYITFNLVLRRKLGR
ncbi:unnamed protein product [Amaranthus hypochondriacus]